MSRSPKMKIDSEKIKQVMKMQNTNGNAICRKCNWSHDYLNQKLREGEMSLARMKVLCNELGVSEDFFLTKEPQEEKQQYFAFQNFEKKPNRFNELLQKIDEAIPEYLQADDDNSLHEYQLSFEKLCD